METKQTYEMHAEYDESVAEEILVSARRIKELERELDDCREEREQVRAELEKWIRDSDIDKVRCEEDAVVVREPQGKGELMGEQGNYIWVKTQSSHDWIWVTFYCHNPEIAFDVDKGDYILGRLSIHKDDWPILERKLCENGWHEDDEL